MDNKSQWRNTGSCFFQNDLKENLTSIFRGHTCIIVNVASKWGKTHVSYTQLVQLYEKYADYKVSFFVMSILSLKLRLHCFLT